MAADDGLDQALREVGQPDIRQEDFRRADTVDLWTETGLEKPQEDEKSALRRDWAIRLRRARNAAELTQAELAERTGMTQPVIARMESPSGMRMPTLLSLDRYLKGCGAEIEIVHQQPEKSATDRKVFYEPVNPNLVYAFAGLQDTGSDHPGGFAETAGEAEPLPLAARWLGGEEQVRVIKQFSASELRVFSKITNALSRTLKTSNKS